MTKDDSKIDLIGRCPVCRAEMVNFGNLVVCPNHDYKALFPKWDAIWTAFYPLTDSAETLIADLLAINTEKPHAT